MEKKDGRAIYPLLIVNLLFLVSCTKVQTKDTPKPNSIFRIGIIGKCSSFDPLYERKLECVSVAKLLFPSLAMTATKDSGTTVRPLLADSWVFETSTRLRIHLRNDIRWTNGAPLQAIHFIEKWKRILSNPTFQHDATILFPIRNARDYYRRKIPFSDVGVRAVGVNTLLIDLESPNSHFIENLSHIALSPEFPVMPPLEAPTLGPYLLQFLSGSPTATLVPNPLFPHPNPPHSEIRVFFQSNAREALEQFNDGALDFVAFEKFSEGELSYPSPQSLYLVLNPRKKIFARREVRHAFLATIQQDEARNLLRWNHTVKTTAFPKADVPSVMNWEGSVPILSYPQMEEAKELAENIRVQWAKAFNAPFELSRSDSDATAAIVATHQSKARDPFELRSLWEQVLSRNLTNSAQYVPMEASLLPWMDLTGKSIEAFEEWLTVKEFFVLPLLNLSRSVYLNPSFKNLSQDVFFNWNFLELETKSPA